MTLTRTVLTGLMLASGLTILGCAKEETTLASTQEAPAPQSAADFTLQDLAGKTISLSQFRGRPILLTFWAVG